MGMILPSSSGWESKPCNKPAEASRNPYSLLCPIHTDLQPGRWYSSLSLPLEPQIRHLLKLFVYIYEPPHKKCFKFDYWFFLTLHLDAVHIIKTIILLLLQQLVDEWYVDRRDCITLLALYNYMKSVWSFCWLERKWYRCALIVPLEVF